MRIFGSKKYYGFDTFIKNLLDQMTNTITLFVFPAFIIFNFLSLSELDQSITLSIEEFYGLHWAAYTIYFAYAFFMIVTLYGILKLIDVCKSEVPNLKKISTRVFAILIIILFGIGLIGSLIWTISIFEAQGKQIQINRSNDSTDFEKVNK